MKAVFFAVLWHVLLAVTGNILATHGRFSNNLSLIFMLADLPGVFIILYQFISVLIGVLSGKYGPRVLKAVAILVLGPIATLYLGWNHGRFRDRD